MADDLFQLDPNDPPALDPDKRYSDELVGEGKKFSDVEALARAKAESDRFIAQLLREARERDEALKKRINEEEFLTKLEALSNRQPPRSENPPPSDRGNEPSAITLESVDELLEKRDAKKKAEGNLAEVERRLKEVYGDDYKRRVQTQAQSLGVSTAELTQLAARSPAVFYRTMGLDQQQRQPDLGGAPPRSSMTPGPSGNQKNFAYYQKMRAEKGDAWYFSVPVRQELWKELTSQGEDAFYKQ